MPATVFVVADIVDRARLVLNARVVEARPELSRTVLSARVPPRSASKEQSSLESRSDRF